MIEVSENVIDIFDADGNAHKAVRNPQACPLCGRDNACGAVRGEDTCWCFDVEMSKEALARVPPELVGVACLCRDCASGAVPSPCVDVCEIEPEAGTCRGCRRTPDEISAWVSMDDAARRDVLDRLVERRRRDGQDRR